MSAVLKALETDRLILRCQSEDDAGVYRQLWMERDPRVPAHRRIDPEGRPTVEDIAAQIRMEREGPRPGLLAVVPKCAGGAVVAWAAEAGYERLWATVRVWNVASRRVLEKLGFHETGQVDADATHGDSLLTVRPLSSPAQSTVLLRG